VDIASSEALASVLRDLATCGAPVPIASVADPAREWAVEAHWHAGRPATWPECPEHPSSHPLTAAVREDRAVRFCPRTGHLVNDIGRIPAPDRVAPTR
jgi:hypothetical protein